MNKNFLGDGPPNNHPDSTGSLEFMHVSRERGREGGGSNEPPHLLWKSCVIKSAIIREEVLLLRFQILALAV